MTCCATTARLRLLPEDRAPLIKGDKIPLLPSGESAAELAVVAGFDEFVDECGDGGEANALVLAACFDTEGGHQVCLAGAGVAEEDDWFGAFQVWLHEKGGKEHEMPAQHNLDRYIDEYI
jgi:hypothetical protein